MLHYSLHQLREADLLREADRRRAVRAVVDRRSCRARAAERVRRLVPAQMRRRAARA
ncbi:hypothetical protein [Kitasatospora sp. NPDC056181]|uniref:hypothetical protein n=1 Tax=Kitasatospora sp. NPDC056181 TaxID=3345737 RepID=UPI0035D7571B